MILSVLPPFHLPNKSRKQHRTQLVYFKDKDLLKPCLDLEAAVPRRVNLSHFIFGCYTILLTDQNLKLYYLLSFKVHAT